MKNAPIRTYIAYNTWPIQEYILYPHNEFGNSRVDLYFPQDCHLLNPSGRDSDHHVDILPAEGKRFNYLHLNNQRKVSIQDMG